MYCLFFALISLHLLYTIFLLFYFKFSHSETYTDIYTLVKIKLEYNSKSEKSFAIGIFQLNKHLQQLSTVWSVSDQNNANPKLMSSTIRTANHIYVVHVVTTTTLSLHYN
jgi:hypothetical protein